MKAWLLGPLLLAAPGAHAESGLTAAAFLQRPLGARAAAMGGAHAAVRDSSDSAQYNPAGLATVSSTTVTTTYLAGLADSRFGLLQAVHPTRFGTFSAGALYYTAGRVDLAFSNGTSRSVTAEENTAWTASYALRLLPGVWAGASYRFLRLRLAEEARATSSQMDLGGMVKLPLYGLCAGGSYQYLGPNITYEVDGDPPPRTVRYGLAFHFPDIDAKKLDPSVDLQAFDAIVAADMVHVLREKRSPRLGIELGLTPAMITRVATRFGWVMNRDSEAMTVGFGLEHGRLRFDFSFGRSRELDSVQQLSLTYHFGKA